MPCPPPPPPPRRAVQIQPGAHAGERAGTRAELVIFLGAGGSGLGVSARRTTPRCRRPWNSLVSHHASDSGSSQGRPRNQLAECKGRRPQRWLGDVVPKDIQRVGFLSRRNRRVSCSRGDDVTRSIDERRLCRPQTPLMRSSGYVRRASGFMARRPSSVRAPCFKGVCGIHQSSSSSSHNVRRGAL